MAKVEALAAGAEEGVMLNTEGYVAECTGDNIFVVKDGIIYTPTVASGSLNGITRRVVIDLAIKAGFELREIQMSRYDMYTADELFLTGTAAEITPISKIGTFTFQPDLACRGLVEAYSEETNSKS